MKFHVVSKDWKETWHEPMYQKELAQASTFGLLCKTNVSGEVFGVDSDFLVLTEQEITEQEAKDFVQLAFLDSVFFGSEEAELVELLTNMTPVTREHYEATIMDTADGRSYEYIHIP